MAQSLVLSSIRREHPESAELRDLRTEKSHGGQACTGMSTEHRAGPHSRDAAVKIRCDRELSMCAVAFPHF